MFRADCGSYSEDIIRTIDGNSRVSLYDTMCEMDKDGKKIPCLNLYTDMPYDKLSFG